MKSLPSISDTEFFKGLDTLWKTSRDEKMKAGKPLTDNDRSKMRRRFLFSGLIQRTDPNLAYHGMTVGPGDKEKVLLCWKLNEGRYQVIFGDLRSETVTAERLRALEK